MAGCANSTGSVSVGQRAEAAVEVFVHGAGVDEVAELDGLPGFAVVGFEADFDVWVREHFCEHCGVAVLGQRLEFFVAKAVVAVGADGDTAADAGVEFAWVAPPLFARVVPEEHLVKRAPDLADDDLLAVAW